MRLEEFADFYDANFRWLVASLIRRGRDVDEAKDIAQDAFIVVLSQIRNGTVIRSPKPYLLSIAYNIAAKRAHTLHREILTGEIREDYAPVAPDAADSVVDQQLILRIIQMLPPSQRTIMGLTYAGFNPTEISGMIDTPATTIRSNIRHARTTLREKLLLEEDQ